MLWTSVRGMRSALVCIVFSAFFVFCSPAWGQNNPSDVNCSPANLLLVVDTSGSMSSAGKLDGLKKAASDVVNQFKAKLRMGLIRFSSGKAELLVPIGPAHAAKPDIQGHAQKLLTAIKGLQATGDTPMTQALELAMNTLLNEIPSDPLHKDPDPKTKRRNFVLLVTDGEPTDATTNYNPLQFIVKMRKLQVAPKEYDVLTFVVGLGDHLNIRTFELQQYAKAGGTQNFLHALKAADLAPFFSRISKTASEEVCNGRDDDCSGQIDEDLQRPCKSNCGEGTEICHKGTWSKCTAPPPGQEICDGKDNNCNGQVDEGLSRACSSQCGKGTQSCIQGDWSTCTAARPEAEICDGIDNDCDGQIDNGQLCKGGTCIATGSGSARCDIPCVNGECPKGYTCDANDKCQEDPCTRKKCPPGTTCDDASGQAVCKDLCAGVKCPNGLTCGASGTCIDCYNEDCPTGMSCVQGKCTVDQCKIVGCPDGQGCRDGKCFDSCQGIQCADGEKCIKGKCQRDLCAGKTCGAGQRCRDGQCIQDRCQGPSAPICGKGRVCNPTSGACEDDPCLRTVCPNGQSCSEGQCGIKPGTKPPPPNSECQQDSDCGAGYSCTPNKTCVKVIGGVTCSGLHMVSGRRSNPIFLLLCLFWLAALGLRKRR